MLLFYSVIKGTLVPGVTSVNYINLLVQQYVSSNNQFLIHFTEGNSNYYERKCENLLMLTEQLRV